MIPRCRRDSHDGALLLKADGVIALHGLERDRAVLLEGEQVAEQRVHVVVRLGRGLEEAAAPVGGLLLALAHRHLPPRRALVALVTHLRITHTMQLVGGGRASDWTADGGRGGREATAAGKIGAAGNESGVRCIDCTFSF